MGKPLNSNRIHASVIKGLSSYLDQLGLDLGSFTARHGPVLGPPETWDHGYISLEKYIALLERVAEQQRDPLFGLRWSLKQGNSGGFRLLTLAMRFAPTPLVALQTMVRFSSLGLDVRDCSVEIRGGKVNFDWVFVPTVQEPHQFLDRYAALVVERFRSSFGEPKIDPLQVDLNRTPPENVQLHRQVFGPSVSFRAERNRIVYCLSRMEAPNPMADPEVYSAMVELCERRLTDQVKAADFAGHVRDIIQAGVSSPDLTLGMVAKEIGMSPRVLQRRLFETGHKFQELHDDVRRAIASNLLRTTPLPVSEIAYRVGFSAVGNFTRAARRWFGMTPREWRRAGAIPVGDLRP